MKNGVALVTGGANGIGLASVRGFLDRGVDVACVDFDTEALAAAERELGGAGPRFLPIRADLSDTSTIAPLMERVVSELGRVDHLVNCAARLGGAYDFLEIEATDWEKTFRVNLLAPMLLMQAFARHAIARGGGGHIVNLSSSSAFRAQRARPAYGSSKGALTTLTRIVAAQLGEHDINVNAVAPGITNTPGATSKRNVDVSALEEKVRSGPNANFFKRVTEAEDVAATVLFLCSPESRQITGQVIHVSAGTIT